MFDLENFLKLIDSVIRLLSVQSMNRKRQFEEVVQPLFTELEICVADSYGFFSETRSNLCEITDEELENQKQQFVKEFSVRKEKMVIARAKVVAMANVLSEEVEDRKIKLFAVRARGIFQSNEVPTLSKFGKASVVFEGVVNGEANKQELIEYCSASMNKLQIRWMKLVQSYGSLRLHSLK